MGTQQSGLKDAQEKNDLWGMLQKTLEHAPDNTQKPLVEVTAVDAKDTLFKGINEYSRG